MTGDPVGPVVRELHRIADALERSGLKPFGDLSGQMVRDHFAGLLGRELTADEKQTLAMATEFFVRGEHAGNQGD